MSTLPGEESARQIRQSWAAIYVLAFLGFAMATGESLTGSMMPLLATGLNASEGMIGQAVTVPAIMAIITSLSVSRIAGNRDRRLLLIIFTVALMMASILAAISPNVWVMLASRLLLGIAIGVNWSLVPAIIVRLVPGGLVARGMAIVMAGASLAGVISAPLAALFGEVIGWRYVFVGAAVIAAVAIVLLALACPPLSFEGGTNPRELGTTLKLPGLIPGMLGMVLIFGGIQISFGYLVPFLESVTLLSASAVSLVLLIVGITGLVGTMMAPRAITINTHLVLVIAPALMALALGLLLLFGHRAIPTVLILMAWVYVRMHIGVGGNTWLAQSFPNHLEAAGGLLVAFIQGAMMLGAMLGGVLIDSIGAKAPQAAAVIILAVGAVYVYRVMKPRPQPELLEELVAPQLRSPAPTTIIVDEAV